MSPPPLLLTYDITQISYFLIESGTLPNTTYTTAVGPAILQSRPDYLINGNWNINQIENTLNVNYIFSVYQGSKNKGTLSFTITAEQPIDPDRPYIFTLPRYESRVTASSGIFECYQNAIVVISKDGNIRDITISKQCCV